MLLGLGSDRRPTIIMGSENMDGNLLTFVGAVDLRKCIKIGFPQTENKEKQKNILQ